MSDADFEYSADKADMEYVALMMRARGEAQDVTREALAAYAHDAWAGWMQYLFKFGTRNEDGTFTINASQVERWSRQMATPYADLSEAEEASDRKEADQILALVQADLAALRARLATLEAALAPALEALEGATPGEWTTGQKRPQYSDTLVPWDAVFGPHEGLIAYVNTGEDTTRLIAAAVNAVRAVKEARDAA